jgi:hypothetical protein
MKRIDNALLWLAARLPGRLRMWVVVDATNTARRLHPDPTGYAGPDGLGYKEIHDGALRGRDAENHARLMEAAVRRATDAVCDFDPDAAAYRMRTEAWVRLALTVALRPPSASLSGQDETTKGRDDG